uniref:GPI ethanolamine phosphate transferase 3 n=1 Tax=Plectus sambesii TaxID=2011161 RepID=A0A914XKF3_9BILA
MRLWTLALVVVGYLAGLYFYSRGFLLTRQTLRLNSSCADVQHPDAPVRGCWLEARFKRAIVLVIDALRFDFVDRQTGPDVSPYYHNRLATIGRLLEERKHQSLLVEFTADPPTTTLQRLKALTTGSLPTFIDAGTNFAGTAIDEDNIIDQLVGLDRNVIFLGDDTWTALFPAQFHRQFPFPSFDVKDLHSVDDGVLGHLYDELNKPDWTLLVAHFLGVDHCGHKYGPSHPEMRRKLDQMDRMIANVTQLLADDTLLIIFGDHGMTTTGDHGGDSPDELAAALFLHSNLPLHSEDNNVLSAVAQVDLVPTLSLLLDFPTPFSSLGTIIPQVFTREQQMAAAKANVEQVVRYAHSYSKQSGDSALSSRLQPLLRTFNSLTPEELTVERCLETVRQMQRIFRECWATFHGPWMLIGVLAMLETLSWTLRLMVDEDRSWGGRAVLKLVTVLLQLIAYFGQQEIIPVALHMLLSLQLVLDLAAIVNGLMVVKQNRLPSLLHAFPFLLLLLHAASFFSNSFVVYERDVIRYLAQTSLLLLLVQRKGVGAPRKPGTAAAPKIPSLWRLICVYFDWKSILFTMVALVLLRSGVMFAKCREEQSECVPSWLTASFQSLHDDADKNVRFLTALASVGLLIFAMRSFLRRNGHLDGHSFKSVALGAAPLLSFTAILVYWVSLWLPDNVWQHYQTAFSLAPPLIVYTLSLMLTALLAINPLLINVVMGEQKREELDESAVASKRKVFQHFKRNWAEYLGQPTGTVFGLASAISGPIVALLLCWTVVLVLLLGDGIVASNFASILRHGLINNMNKVSAFGEGTYLSTELSLSLNWSPMSAVDSNGKRVGCVALCEIVNDPSGVKIGCNESVVGSAKTVPNKYFIVRNDELVIVRYLLVYEHESKPPQTSNQQRLFHRTLGWLSTHRFWLLMCLYFSLLMAVGLASSSNFRFYWKRLFAQYWPNHRHNDHHHYDDA